MSALKEDVPAPPMSSQVGDEVVVLVFVSVVEVNVKLTHALVFCHLPNKRIQSVFEVAFRFGTFSFPNYHHVPLSPSFHNYQHHHHHRRWPRPSKVCKPKLALCAYYTIRILQGCPLKNKIKNYPSLALLLRTRALHRTQVRPSRPPKGDSDAQWSHDLYEDPDKPSLSSRLSGSAAAPRKPDSTLVQRAIREATAAGGISIKGASTSANGNVVQVDGLVKGTTPADVEVCLFSHCPAFSDIQQAIFRRCGPIIASDLVNNQASDNVTVRLTFKQAAHAAAAVSKFDKQPADGRILRVIVVGVQSVGLSGRLGGVNLVNENGSVDVLMSADDNAGS